MARPDYQTIQEAYDQPARILDALPKSGLRDRAEQLLDQSRKYAYEIREKITPQEPDPEPAEASVTMTALLRGTVVCSVNDGGAITTAAPGNGSFWTTCYRLDHLHLHQEGSCGVAS